MKKNVQYLICHSDVNTVDIKEFHFLQFLCVLLFLKTDNRLQGHKRTTVLLHLKITARKQQKKIEIESKLLLNNHN